MFNKFSRKAELIFGALLADLSKAFDCFSHKLLVVKLIAYGVEMSSIRLIYAYLTDRKQRTKIGNNNKFWRSILFEIRQGSILGPLLFNINICDMFFLT